MKKLLFGALLAAPLFVKAQETLKGNLEQKNGELPVETLCAQKGNYFVLVDKTLSPANETVLDFSEYTQRLNYNTLKNQTVAVTGKRSTKGTCKLFVVKDIRAYDGKTLPAQPIKPQPTKTGSNNQGIPPKQKAETSQKSDAVQCSAKTQKGTRCKNMTTNPNGRCHKH